MATGQLGTVLRHLRTLAAGPGSRELTDAQLLHRYTAAADPEAFAALVERHGSLVLSVCRHVLHHDHDAEDAFQATFFVLARKAGSVRKGEALASWLHGVAYRSALQVKRAAARRRTHEQRAATMPPNQPYSETAWREFQAVLDEEVQALPAKYRSPFVLCCLEGKSKAEAAQELGWKEGTVSGRLAQARKQLQGRLSRRGISLAAVLGALALAPQASRAALPAGLVVSTVGAALRYAAGRGAGAVPLQIAAVAQGVTRAMFLSKMKLTLVLALLLGVAATAIGLVARPALADKPQAPAEAIKKPPAPPPIAVGDGVEVSGRVLDPDGKPVAGAKVYRAYHLENTSSGLLPPAALRTRSGPDGHFRFTLGKSELAADRRDRLQVVAVAEGCGPGWLEAVKPEAGQELTLRLVKDDVPIRGRVLDLEGRPVRGAVLMVFGIGATAGEDLTPLVTALRDKPTASLDTFMSKLLAHPLMGAPGVPLTVTTGADGRFLLKGIGRERVALIMLGGPKVQSELLLLMTRPGGKYLVPDYPGGEAVHTLYGATFDHLAAPPQPVVGTVRDRDTGRPVAGVKVAIDPVMMFATTGKDGKFRLDSLPNFAASPGDRRLPLLAVPPAGEPYLATFKEVQVGPRSQPTALDFELKKGVWVEGRVTDQATGKPVRVHLTYSPASGNPRAGDLPSSPTFQSMTTDLYPARADGSFRLPALPGPGLISARDPKGDYRPVSVHINPPQDGRPTTCNLLVGLYPTLTGTVLGPDGKPVAGAHAFGVRYPWAWVTTSGGENMYNPKPLSTAAFTLRTVEPGRRRSLVFLHQAKHLAATLELRGKEQGPLTVRLGPAGVITGQLVNEDGQPRPGIALRILFVIKADDSLSHYFPERLATDAQGRFRFENLAPGLVYQILEAEKPGSGKFGVVARKVSVRAGETKDLSKVQAKPVGP